MIKLSVLVPVFNEAPILPSLLGRIDATLKAAKIKYEVIAIDDHSSDGSLKVLEQLALDYPLKAYVKKGAQGKAQSILEAAEHAQADLVCMIDSDLQYPPEVIPEMVKLAEQHGVVVARRKTYDGSLLRRVGSRVLAFGLGRLLLGLNVDIQSGLKVFHKNILDMLPKEEVTPWALDLPLLHTATELGHTVGEVPIVFEKRPYGESKLSLFKPTLQIINGAVRLKFKKRKPIEIKPQEKMIGAGIIHKQQKFITHTTLHHQHSALTTFTPSQRNLILGFLGLIVLGLLINPLTTAVVVVGLLSFVYFVDVVFNFFLILKSLHSPPELSFTHDQLAELKDKDLPVYSILCPLYREAHILPGFLDSIKKLDWPKAKLDVMLLFEEDDQESIDAAKDMDLPDYVRVVVVPDSQPKTKPKACNYGLNFAKGEYVVIYDAEDIPDPQQLKKAYLGFQVVGPKVKCLQAKLNYYNPFQNWLTRFFTAEYSLWFDVILTGLQSIETTIPLGGTSNHFRTEDLHQLQGWDPFNVTEDCDLGVRLFKNGYKTAIIDSTTMEEANSNFKNWLRQRSRWIKGYMQTYLIHMRDPISFASTQGVHAFLFQLTVGGKLVFILINPLLWILTASYFALYAYVGPAIEALYPSIVFYMAATSLIFGNFMYLYYYMIGCAKREHWSLVKWVFMIPIYWLMVSIAALIALYQLIVKPHYWEKTIHGLHLKKKELKKQAKSVTSEVVAEVTAHGQEITLPNGPAAFAPNPGHLSRSKIIREKLKFFSFRRVLGALSHSQFRNGGLFIIATLVANVLNLATNIYLGSHLSLEQFGVFNFAVSLLYLISIPINALGGTINYKTGFLLGKHNQKSLTAFWRYTRHRTFLLAFGISIGWLVISPILANIFHVASVWLFASFALVWLLSLMLAVDSGYLNGRLLLNYMAVIIFLQPLVRVLAAVGLAEVAPELTYLALPAGILAALGVAYLGAREGNDQVTEKHEFHLPRHFFLATLMAGFSGIAYFSLDNLLVSHLLDAREVGQYSFLGLFGKMIFFIGSLTSVFLAPIVARYEGAGRDSRKVFRYTLLSVAVMTAIAYAGFGWGILWLLPYLPLAVANKVAEVHPFVVRYGLGVAAFAVSQVIVSYHLLKKHYFFPAVSVILSLVQVISVLVWGASFNQVVTIMTGIGFVHLLTFGFFHLIYRRIAGSLNNIPDLLGLFDRNPIRLEAPSSTKSLNILIFNWRDTRHVWAGGAELYIHQIAKRLVSMGHRVTVFCGNDGKSPRNEVIDGVQMVRRGGFYTVYVWAFLYYVLRFRNLFDIVIDSENGIPFLTPLFVKRPIYLLIHHVHQNVFRQHLRFPLQQIALFIEGQLMPWLYQDSQVITVSESSKSEILHLGLGSPLSIEVINPGIEVPQKSKSRKTSHPSLCFVGRLKPYKNVDVALKAFAQILPEYPKATFVIAGTGEASSSLKKLAKELGIEDAVEFKGNVDEHQKSEMYAQSWLAIQPSMVEGWGITVIEANAHATPVIASNVPGLRDSILDGKSGLLVAPGDPEAFAKAIKTVFNSKSLRNKLSKQALEWSDKFTWDRSAQQLMTFIHHTLLENKSTEPSSSFLYEKKFSQTK